MSDHEQLADEAEHELQKLEQENARVGDDIEEARKHVPDGDALSEDEQKSSGNE